MDAEVGESLLELADLLVGTPYIETTYRYRYAVIRYHPDGTIDRTFGRRGLALAAPTSHSSYPTDAVPLPDGAILVVGTYDYQNPADPKAQEPVFAARLHPDGSPDTTFGRGGLLLTDLQPAARDNEDDVGRAALTGPTVLLPASSYRPSTGQSSFFTLRY